MVKGGARLVHPFVPNLCTCFVCIVLPVAARRRYAMLRCARLLEKDGQAWWELKYIAVYRGHFGKEMPLL